MSEAKKDHVADCKPPLKYVHPEVMDGCAYGMLAGALKYDPWNFLKGHDQMDLIDAAIRHLQEHRMGRTVDVDTTNRLMEVYGEKAPNIKHLWLALCNINMLIWQHHARTSKDSWPKGVDE